MSSGMGVVVGVGHESTWGAVVARNKFVENMGVSGGLRDPLVEAASFRGRQLRRTFRGIKMIDAELVTELGYEGWEDYFLHLFGKVTSSLINVTVRQHVFEIDDTVADPKGLSVEVNYDAADVVLWAGCKVERVTFAFEMEKLVKMTVRLLGKDETVVTATTPVYPSLDLPVRFDHVLLKKDAVAVDVVSGEVTIDRRRLVPRPALGNRNTKEPAPGRAVVTAKLVADFEDRATWKALLAADTSARVEFVGTSDQNIAGASPTTPYSFDLDLLDCKVRAHDAPVSDFGYIRQTIDCVARSTGGNSVAKLTMKNLRASVP